VTELFCFRVPRTAETTALHIVGSGRGL